MTRDEVFKKYEDESQAEIGNWHKTDDFDSPFAGNIFKFERLRIH